jgi:hypothetical protein
MPRHGAYIVSELPEGLTEIACAKCGRRGRYKRETLLERFGPDKALPDVLIALADCPRAATPGDPCQVRYARPLGAVSASKLRQSPRR